MFPVPSVRGLDFETIKNYFFSEMVTEREEETNVMTLRWTLKGEVDLGFRMIVNRK